MAFNTTAVNLFLTNFASATKYASLHFADPGAAGTSEITGGTPAYARKSIAWATAVNGVRDSSTVLTFDVPAGVSITHFGIWSAATGGTFYGGVVLRDAQGVAATEVYTSQGSYQLTKITMTCTAS